MTNRTVARLNAVPVFVPLLLGLAALCGCAAAPERTAGRAACGALPPAFHAPVTCPVEKERAPGHGMRCFPASYNADRPGGLNVPAQIVCPFAAREEEDRI